MAQQGQTHPATMGAMFKNLMSNVTGSRPGNHQGNQQQQNNGNGQNRQSNANGGGGNDSNGSQQHNQQQQNPAHKFDPETGKPISNGSTNNPETQPDPLKVYENLWKKVDGEEQQAPRFSIDGKVINEAAGGLSFSSNLPDDLDLTGLGDNKDTILALMDHIGRMTYATSINHMSQLTDKFYDVRSKHDFNNVPGMVKDTMTMSGLDGMEVAQKSPVVKESLRMIGKSLRAQYPDATPEWIQQHATRFFMDMAQAIHPDQFQQQELQNQQQAKAPGGQDFEWDNWLEGKNKAV